MKRVYIITGANGHLGGTLVRALQGLPVEVRGLILPGEAAVDRGNVRYYRGDVCQPDTLRPLFEDLEEGAAIRVIHTAGIVDISEDVSPKVYDVNVNGTRNVLALCREFGARLVYVSSVHAIPEADDNLVQEEIRAFSPDRVIGGYAKTKAEATQAVLDAARDGLDAVVVQPSGILGPFEASGNHMVQMVSDYVHGRLPACVVGGYDFVDVRDVAKGCLQAAEKGRRGRVLHPLQPALRNPRPAQDDPVGLRRTAAAGAADVDGARGGAASAGVGEAAPRAAAVHALFPPRAWQQQQVQPRQGDHGAGLSPARPVSDDQGHRRVAEAARPLGRAVTPKADEEQFFHTV